MPSEEHLARPAAAPIQWSPLPPRRPPPSEHGEGKKAAENLYPHCDVSIWLRSCEQEIVQPMEGLVTGSIPKWLKGSLLRNGPGSLKVGDMTFDHLFDSSALLHRFCVRDGRVTYQSRFLQSRTFKRNAAARRIVVSEFGTRAAAAAAVPDPCHSIFQRVSAIFKPGENLSDNAMISVYPFGDEFYTFTESPVIHRIDPSTLETLERVNVADHVGIVNHSSHPLVMEDGTVFNLGLKAALTGPRYVIVRFPPPDADAAPAPDGHHSERGGGASGSAFARARVAASAAARWALHPSYMHSFGLSQRFFVVVEQPLSVSVPAAIAAQITHAPLAPCLRWFPDETTKFLLLCRETGKLKYEFESEAFFFLHVINCFEEDDHVIVDICCYRDPSMLDCMYVESLKGLHSNPDYARMFRSRPLRFVLPLHPPGASDVAAGADENLVRLRGSGACAWRVRGGGGAVRVRVHPEVLCALGCETPQLHRERCAGRPYRFFYAISSDVDLRNPGTLIKVDTHSRTCKTWCEDNAYPSEPIFVPAPDAQAEDDGVVLSALVWGGGGGGRDSGDERRVALLVLDAASWSELGRATFLAPGPVPKCLHGWFTPNH